MTQEQVDLAIRLLDLELPSGIRTCRIRDQRYPSRPTNITLPDLTDDATGGVLLGMLPRDARAAVYRQGSNPEWTVELATGVGSHEGTTLAEACAKALLAVHA